MKLCPHLQTVPSWAPTLFNGRVSYVKQMFYNGDSVDQFPQCRTIARLWIGGDHVEGEYIKQGIAGARAYFDRLLPWYKALRGKVYAYESPNEPYVGDAEARNKLSIFTWEWVRLMRSYQLRSISGRFSRGNPDVTDPQAIRELWGAFAGTFLGVDEYGWPTMQECYPWYSLRHRFLVQVRKGMGLATNPIFIGETGLDGTEYNRGGWQDVCNWETYRDQLRWYDSELAKDRNVLAAFVFTSGPWEGQWTTFNMGYEQWRELLEV
jgi:hypothetical protein